MTLDPDRVARIQREATVLAVLVEHAGKALTAEQVTVWTPGLRGIVVTRALHRIQADGQAQRVPNGTGALAWTYAQ